jgi:membrane-bound lytic murein transglycosylase B
LSRFWIIIGLLLAAIGALLLSNGLNVRFRKLQNLPQASVAAPQPMPSDTLSSSRTVPKVSPVDSTPSIAEKSVSPHSIILKEPIDPVPTPAPQTSQSIATPESELKSDELPPLQNDPDKRKQILIDRLRKDGWNKDELSYLSQLLNDPRCHYRTDLLVRNSTFEENAEIYAHNLKLEAINRCVDFLRDQLPVIERATTGDDVPPEVMVAILKVETNLGGWTGKESVFNVFWSLAVGDNPEVQRALLTGDPEQRAEMKQRMTRRAGWARGQLRDLLYVAKHGGEDPVGIMGSFAGAFGMPQFIPSSYRSYGRDGDGDGVVDLDNLADATASIGYYLKENGWRVDSSRARRRKVILTYNHSDFYADCVMALADSISLRTRGAIQP